MAESTHYPSVLRPVTPPPSGKENTQPYAAASEYSHVLEDDYKLTVPKKANIITLTPANHDLEGGTNRTLLPGVRGVLSALGLSDLPGIDTIMLRRTEQVDPRAMETECGGCYSWAGVPPQRDAAPGDVAAINQCTEKLRQRPNWIQWPIHSWNWEQFEAVWRLWRFHIQYLPRLKMGVEVSNLKVVPTDEPEEALIQLSNLAGQTMTTKRRNIKLIPHSGYPMVYLDGEWIEYEHIFNITKQASLYPGSDLYQSTQNCFADKVNGRRRLASLYPESLGPKSFSLMDLGDQILALGMSDIYTRQSADLRTRVTVRTARASATRYSSMVNHLLEALPDINVNPDDTQGDNPPPLVSSSEEEEVPTSRNPFRPPEQNSLFRLRTERQEKKEERKRNRRLGRRALNMLDQRLGKAMDQYLGTPAREEKTKREEKKSTKKKRGKMKK